MWCAQSRGLSNFDHVPFPCTFRELRANIAGKPRSALSAAVENSIFRVRACCARERKRNGYHRGNETVKEKRKQRKEECRRKEKGNESATLMKQKGGVRERERVIADTSFPLALSNQSALINQTACPQLLLTAIFLKRPSLKSDHGLNGARGTCRFVRRESFCKSQNRSMNPRSTWTLVRFLIYNACCSLDETTIFQFRGLWDSCES